MHIAWGDIPAIPLDGMTDRRSARDYSIFGLTVRSDLDLPELRVVDEAAAPDVTIALGSIPDSSGPGFHPRDGGALLAIEGIAGFLVTAGDSIIVDPEPGAHERNIRLYLLGSAMGLLLHQRGLLPLHANAIEIAGKAVAFIGPSGSGKSTLAAWFHDRGYPIIADDVCVIHFDKQGRPLAAPGLPRLRLWREMLEATGRDPSQHVRSYAGADEWEKYDVPLAGDRVATSPVQLAAVYLLKRDEHFSITKLAGVAAADALFANTYRGALVPRSGKPRAHWESCLRLIEGARLWALRRPWEPGLIDQQGEAIVAHVRGTVRGDRKSSGTG